MIRKSELLRRIRDLERELDAAKGRGTANPHVLWLVETAEVCLKAATMLGKNLPGAFPDDDENAAAPTPTPKEPGHE